MMKTFYIEEDVRYVKRKLLIYIDNITDLINNIEGEATNETITSLKYCLKMLKRQLKEVEEKEGK